MIKLHKKVGLCLGSILAFSLFTVSTAKSEDIGETDSPQTAAPSRSTVRLCNRSSSWISIATVHWAGRAKWQSKGWQPVESGECAPFELSNDVNRLYYYAENRRGNTWSGNAEASFCIANNAFTFSQADRMRCDASKQRRVRMGRVDVSPGGTSTRNLR